MASSVREALRRLIGRADSGELGRLCARHGIDLMVVFGSAAQDEPDPHDLDLAVRFAPDGPRDVLILLDELYRMVDLEAVDVMVLNDAGPVARERAMVQGAMLHQSRDGVFATEQIAAIMGRLDTDHLRRLELELMAE